ncbi:hypothetical protein JXB41_07785 [Candidatus Woesearchaeota archaeon]|nr:hypothetical protein [Candidatus Woesearchaeota archaeon]
MIFLFLVFVLGCTSDPKQTVKLDNQTEQEKQNDTLTETAEEINCPPVFSYEFTEFSKIDAFQPIGSITGASRGRSYIIIKKGETVPVYAPMDATLISVIYAYRGPDADHGEYGFLFDTGCGVTFLLDHLDSASEELKRYAPAEPSRSTATNDLISIPVKGGTLLGYTDGTPLARTFDFLALDSAKTGSYINPDRWKWDQSLYAICPYDLYEDNLKEKYYQKIGTIIEGKFRKAEDCGKTIYDIENTISGGWFLDEKSTDLEGEFLLIGQQTGVVDLVVKTDREGIKLRITDYDPVQLPENIGIGESVCYQGFNNDWVYVHLIGNRTIEINNGRDACPSSFPTKNAKKYYR